MMFALQEMRASQVGKYSRWVCLPAQPPPPPGTATVAPNETDLLGVRNVTVLLQEAERLLQG